MESLVRKDRDIALYVPKSGRPQYKKGQRGEEGKSQRKGERYWGNKINPMIEKGSGSEANVSHLIIYEYEQRLMVLR